MVVEADTVVDPRAVVVVTFYAALAHVAVAGARSANRLTVSAKHRCIKHLHHLNERNFRVFIETRILVHHQ